MEPRERRQRLGGLLRNWVNTSNFSCLAATDLGKFAQAFELAAVRSSPGRIAQPLRGVVADLFETHQVGEHDAFSTDSFGILECGGEILHRALVECGLG